MYQQHERSLCGVLNDKATRGITAGAITLAVACLSASAQISFVDTVDFSGFRHGSVIDPGANLSSSPFLGTTLSVTPPAGGFDQAVIFASQNSFVINDPNSPDPDLIANSLGNIGAADLGNLAIIQENTDFTITNGRIDRPFSVVDDHANGGTFSFDLNPGTDVTVNAFQFDFIDVEASRDLTVVAFDGANSFTFSGGDLRRLQRDIVFADGAANRTSLITAQQAGLTQFTRVDIISTTSFGIDNFTVAGTAIPEISSSFMAILSAGLFCLRRKRSR